MKRPLPRNRLLYILVSGCLLGEKCAYDGASRTAPAVVELKKVFGCVVSCPEMSGGLGCPRERHEISGGDGEDVLDGRARVISCSGQDNTTQFIKGALTTLRVARLNNVTAAVLKSGSPSCGSRKIHSGSFDGTLRGGAGVTAALLRRHDIPIFSENEIHLLPVKSLKT